MKQTQMAVIAGVSVTAALAMVLTNHIVHGQSQPPASIYNPYPTGILPSNLDTEIARVLREVNFIEAEAITQWKAIPPPTVTGNPPTLQNTGTALVEILGKLMNFDTTISPFNDEACSSCHMPYAG
jgi:cytochrome c peroxidase